MDSITLKEVGITGTNAEEDKNHFRSNLNRVTIDGTEDYRLVLFFIKKGTVMPLHDHPNMSVYFKLMYGKLSYFAYDKIDPKHKYNQFTEDEYSEILETNMIIDAKKSKKKLIGGSNLLLVRPSLCNMHKFIAEEDSCFFDICLPNYTTSMKRRLTFFEELPDTTGKSSETKN